MLVSSTSMKAAIATTTPISHGLTLGRHGSEDRADFECSAEESSDRGLRRLSALSAMIPAGSCRLGNVSPGFRVPAQRDARSHAVAALGVELLQFQYSPGPAIAPPDPRASKVPKQRAGRRQQLSLYKSVVREHTKSDLGWLRSPGRSMGNGELSTGVGIPTHAPSPSIPGQIRVAGGQSSFGLFLSTASLCSSPCSSSK